MAELNGDKGQGRCPGDGDEAKGIAPCRRWQATFEPGVSAESRREQIKTCETCTGRAPRQPSAADDQQDVLLARVESLVLQQKAGRQFGMADLSPLEWNGLICWHSNEDAYQRAHQVRVKQLFEVLVTFMTARR